MAPPTAGGRNPTRMRTDAARLEASAHIAPLQPGRSRYSNAQLSMLRGTPLNVAAQR